MTSLALAAKSLLGEQPIGFIDIGARGGVHPLVEDIAASVAVLGFEPDAEECRRIGQSADQTRFAELAIEPAALYDRKGTATLHEIVAPTNSSLLAPNPKFVRRYDMRKWHEIGSSKVETTTLDEVIFNRLTARPHWGEVLKIDTQGTEFEILVGAERTLTQRALFLCIEVSFCELYLGQKLFSDVEIYLRQRGFAFYGFDRIFNRSRKTLDKRTNWGRERMIQADAFFFRDPFDGLAATRAIDRRSRLVMAIFATITGFHDFALELIEEFDDVGAFRDAILQRAQLSPEKAGAEVGALREAIKEKPTEANVLVGRFVDQRRGLNDYFDVI